MASACALAIISGIGFFIRDSEKPAGFSESPFHGRGYPLRLTTFASSPKGTPLSYTGNFAATTEAVPLGKVAKPQALTEGVSQKRTPPVAYGDSPL